MYVSGTIVISQKKLDTFDKRSLSYLHDIQETFILAQWCKDNQKCDHTPLHKIFTTHIPNSKMYNWGTEIASKGHVTFEHIKGKENS